MVDVERRFGRVFWVLVEGFCVGIGLMLFLESHKSELLDVY